MTFTTDSLSPALADRIWKLMARSQSPFDNEALTAVRMANKTLAEAGLSWEQALTPAPPAPQPRRQKQQNHYRDDDWRQDVHFCLEENREARGGLLTTWEVDFLHNLLNFRQLSPKQRALLDRLKMKVMCP